MAIATALHLKILHAGGRFSPDTLKTKYFTLTDLSSDRVLLNSSVAWRQGWEFPPLDDYGNALGFSLQFFGETLVRLNSALSGWNRDGVYEVTLDPYISPGFTIGLRNPADYRWKSSVRPKGNQPKCRHRSSEDCLPGQQMFACFGLSTMVREAGVTWRLSTDSGI